MLPTASNTFLLEEMWMPGGAGWKLEVTVQMLLLRKSKQFYLKLTEYLPVKLLNIWENWNKEVCIMNNKAKSK